MKRPGEETTGVEVGEHAMPETESLVSQTSRLIHPKLSKRYESKPPLQNYPDGPNTLPMLQRVIRTV